MTPGHPCQVWICLFGYFCLALVYAPSKLTVVRIKRLAFLFAYILPNPVFVCVPTGEKMNTGRGGRDKCR